MQKIIPAIFFFLCLVAEVKSQSAYKFGDIVKDFSFQKTLNPVGGAGKFSSLQKEITIIDFFGTWCAPCIKALPHLKEIQKAYSNKVAIVLISLETEAQLKKFIEARTDFAFQVVVDENKTINGLFQPPAYPYTIAINSNNEIVGITDAASVNNEMINQWLLSGKKKEGEIPPASEMKTTSKMLPTQITPSPMNSLLQLSQDFIYAAKTGNATAPLEEKLRILSFDSLRNLLPNDDDKKAFWINLYNGFTQVSLKKNQEQYKSRSSFFGAKNIGVAGKLFSLDQIEHGILRRSKIKWSLGYLNKLFPGKTEKALRVNRLDYRIHFSLNCGAKSCPPIAFYEASKINTQLDVATRAYLTSEANYDSTKNKLELPAILGWFRHDFSGKKNMLRLVKNYNIVPETKYPAISFKRYDWALYLDNYKKSD